MRLLRVHRLGGALAVEAAKALSVVADMGDVTTRALVNIAAMLALVLVTVLLARLL